MKQIRQGDVFLRKVDAIPEDVQELVAEDGRLILARGEATGHHHSVDAQQARLCQVKQQMFLMVTARMLQLIHQEHAPLAIPEGIYEVIRQREYTPAEIRRVAD